MSRLGMSRALGSLTTVGVLTVAAVGFGSPAAEAAVGSRISLSASPASIAAGARITLSGRVGPGTTNNAGIVRLYFRRYGATAFTLITTTRSAPTGRFATQTRQTTSGHWKAVYSGNRFRRAAASAFDYVEAKAWRTVTSTRFTRSGTGDYRSDVLRWNPSVSARVQGRGNCPDASDSNFLRVNWTGHPDWSYASATVPFAGATASGDTYIYPDKATGYIEITTQDRCTWTVTITQSARSFVRV